MTHLSEEILYAHAFDQSSFTAEAQAHLSGCEQCREHLSWLTQLTAELTIAKHSQPRLQTLQNYYALFGHVQQQPSLLARSVQWLQAQLSWDSRQQPVLQGIRSGISSTYRLLYSSDVADIEFLVEPRNGSRRIEGEIIPIADALELPALLHLVSSLSAEVVGEIECDDQGRFMIEAIKPGEYELSVMPRQGSALQIVHLELT